jgi:phage/conjugal plasmid C-4 type zinc finger TraR family protein
MDKFADVLDLAQAHTEREIQLRIAAIRRRAHSGFGCEYCVDCGEPIPAIRCRHIPNANRCATCQETEERRHTSVRRCCAA